MGSIGNCCCGCDCICEEGFTTFNTVNFTVFGVSFSVDLNPDAAGCDRHGKQCKLGAMIEKRLDITDPGWTEFIVTQTDINNNPLFDCNCPCEGGGGGGNPIP